MLKVRTVSFLALLLAGSGARAQAIPVGGRVLAPGGRPLADARVELRALVGESERLRLLEAGEAAGDPAIGAKTEADGRFRLEAPGAGLWTLRIEAAGFVPLETDLQPLIEALELPDARLELDAGITVRVVGPDGAAVADARVVARADASPFDRGAEAWRLPVRTGRTGPDGTVRLPRGERERVNLTAGLPGLGPAEARGCLGTAARLRLPPGVPAPLAVRSADGQPASGVLVTAGALAQPLGLTGADGRLEARLAGAAAVPLRLAAPDGRSLTVRHAPPAPGAVVDAGRVFVLPERLAVSGKLIDAETRRAIEGGVVWNAGNPLEAAISDRSGGFALRAGAGELLRITARATGYLGDSGAEFQLADDGRPGPTIALAPAAAIEGRVVDGEGRPVAGATVEVEAKSDPNAMRIEFGGPRSAPAARTGARGSFRLGSLEPQQGHVVRARAEGFAPAEQSIEPLGPRQVRAGVSIALAAGRRLVGASVDGEGRPVPDVAVRLLPARPRVAAGMIRLAGAAPGPAGGAASDREGRFEIAGVAAGTYDVELSRAGFATRKLPGVEVPSGGDDPVDLGPIALEPGECLSGTVTDEERRPLAGVEVTLVPDTGAMTFETMLPAGAGASRPDAQSDGTGWFSVCDLAPGARVALRLHRPGYSDATPPAVEVPRVEPLTVALAAASDVSGQVQDSDGEPLPGARVSLERTRVMEIGNNSMVMMVLRAEQADAEGRFTVEDEEPGRVTLEASAPGYQPGRLADIEIPRGQDRTGLELRLQPGGILQGRVIAPDGRPAIGARVRAVAEEPEGGRFGPGGIQSDGAGYFRLDGLPPGPLSIEATHDDHPRTVRDVEIRPGINTVELQFEGGLDVAGRVVDEAGGAVPAARVRLAPSRRPWGGSEALAGADGTFEFSGVTDGQYTLWVEAQGFAPSGDGRPVTVAGEAVRDLEVRLGRGAVVRGKVLGLGPGEHARVTVRSAASSGLARVSSAVDFEGHYRLEHLPAGEHEIVAEFVDSGRSARERVRVAGTEETQLDLRFVPGLALSGHARRAGAAVAGATVIAENLDRERTGWAQTDEHGAFRVEGLEAGRHTVRLREWRTGLAHDVVVDLAADRRIEIEVPEGRVAGRITDSAERGPLAGVSLVLEPVVEAERPQRLPTHTATTDLEGRFAIDSVADGSFRLTATRKGYAAAVRTVVVQGQRGEERLQIAMDPTEGLTLEVRAASGAAPAEVGVAVLDAAGVPWTSGQYPTGENGRVRLTTVPHGSWRLVVAAEGWATESLDVSVPGAAVPVTLGPPTVLGVRVPALTGTGSSATARVSDAAGRPFYFLDWNGAPRRDWRLFDGRARIDGLPPGDWSVAVTAGGNGNWSGRQTTASGAPTELVLE